MSSTQMSNEPATRIPTAGMVDMTLGGRHHSGVQRRSRQALLREIKTRLPERGLSMDVATLTELLRDAEKRHGNYEATAPKRHWSGWYAAYIVARERGRAPEEAAEDAAHHMEGAR